MRGIFTPPLLRWHTQSMENQMQLVDIGLCTKQRPPE
jgi:hypothetical protein